MRCSVNAVALLTALIVAQAGGAAKASPNSPSTEALAGDGYAPTVSTGPFVPRVTTKSAF